MLSAGCEASRRLDTYPAGALAVQYEPASDYSACLVASVTMAANYLAGEHRYAEPAMLAELRQAGLDPSRAGDLKRHLSGKGLHLLTLAGRLEGRPPAGLFYWLRERGYPVICVINRSGTNLAYNHAVVVIGAQEPSSERTGGAVHYLDPSADEPLQTCTLATFEEMWQRGQWAMMVVLKPPADPSESDG